jgi:hypothetical protein
LALSKEYINIIIFVSGLIPVLLIGGPAGAASKVCSNKDLSGDYLFNEVEIWLEVVSKRTPAQIMEL